MYIEVGTTARRWLAAAAAVATLCLASSAHALVTTPVGGRPGQADVNVRAMFERGLIEPVENRDAWQTANWEIYTVGGGYTVGDLGPLQDLFVRLEVSWYDSPAEIVPDDGKPAPTVCGGRVLADGRCQIHPSDRGTLITPQVGFNLLHPGPYSFGLFFQGNVPLDVNYDKFVLPRTDIIGGGLAWAVRFSKAFSYEGRFFLGSGPLNGKQNATTAIITNFKLEAERWLIDSPIGIAFGPYFDADFTQRYDENYDNTFVSGVPTTDDGTVSGPGDTRDRIRMMRFGYSLSPYIKLGDSFALEGNFTQKLFGYDTPATRFFSIGARAAF